MINVILKRYDEKLPLLSGGKFLLKAPENIEEGINILDYGYHLNIPKGYKLKIESQNSYIWVLNYQLWEEEYDDRDNRGGLEILIASRFELPFFTDFDLFEVTLVKKTEETDERFRFIEMNSQGKRVIGGSPSPALIKVVNKNGNSEQQ